MLSGRSLQLSTLPTGHRETMPQPVHRRNLPTSSKPLILANESLASSLCILLASQPRAHHRPVRLAELTIGHLDLHGSVDPAVTDTLPTAGASRIHAAPGTLLKLCYRHTCSISRYGRILQEAVGPQSAIEMPASVLIEGFRAMKVLKYELRTKRVRGIG